MKKNILVLILVLLSSFSAFSQKVRTTAVFDADTTTRPKSGFFGIGIRGNVPFLVRNTGNTIRFGMVSSFTNNYLPKFNANGAFVNSQIFDDGTNVGIGTASPSQKLDVNGNIKLSGVTTSASFSRSDGLGVGGIGWDGDYFYVGGHPGYLPGAGNSVRLYAFGGFVSLGNATSGDVLNVTIDGKVGIGTYTPTTKLQVVGLPVYADNTTATSAGLTVGAFYRTSTGVLMVVY